MGKRTLRELGMDMHTPLYLNGITNEAYCSAQGTLLEVRQPGWQRAVREWARVSVWLRPSAVHLKLSQHC